MAGILTVSTEPAARAIFANLAGQNFETWKAFGRAFRKSAQEIGPDLPLYFDAPETIVLADERNWIEVRDDGSVIVATEFE